MSFIKKMTDLQSIYMNVSNITYSQAEVLVVFWLTTDQIVKKLLPPPLKPLEDPLAIASVANYPKSNIGLPFLEAALFIGAEFEGTTGFYCLSMPVTNDMMMAAGREIRGYPNKLAKIHLKKEEKNVIGWVERHGERILELQGEISGSFNTKTAQVVYSEYQLDTEEMIIYNYIRRVITLSAAVYPQYASTHLYKQNVKRMFDMHEIGAAKILLSSSKYDPWAEVEISEVLGAVYARGKISIPSGEILTKVDHNQLSSYAFNRWDW